MTDAVELSIVDRWLNKHYKKAKAQFKREEYNSEKMWGHEAQQNMKAFVRIIEYIESLQSQITKKEVCKK